MAWGLVFFSVNAVNVVRLILERKEVKFTPEEHKLYKDHFEEFSVPLHEFTKLLAVGEWQTLQDGDVVQSKGEPNYDIIMLNRGTVAAYSENGASTPKYTYTATGTDGGADGSVIGGTALVDQSVLGRPYPNQLRAVGSIVYIRWDVKALLELLKRERLLESAFIHSLYIDLIEGLRRNRQETKREASQEELCHKETHEVATKLMKYQAMLKEALDAGEEQGFVPPSQKRKVMRFATEQGVTRNQRTTILASMGWTEEDWLVGARDAPPLSVYAADRAKAHAGTRLT